MVWEREGQSVVVDDKSYTVGGTVWDASKHRDGQFGTIQKIYTDDRGKFIAHCEFEDSSIKELELAKLEPVSQTVPAEMNQQLYTLFCYYNGSGGTLTKVLGISSDKSVLLRLMLEDMKETPDVPLTFSLLRAEEDILEFEFELDDFSDPTYVEYTIVPAPIYPTAKEAAV